jgi:nephrocystin-3
MDESEKALTEALRIDRELAKTNPQANLPNLAQTLNTLGVLYEDTQSFNEAVKVLTEALNIRRELART